MQRPVSKVGEQIRVALFPLDIPDRNREYRRISPMVGWVLTEHAAVFEAEGVTARMLYILVNEEAVSLLSHLPKEYHIRQGFVPTLFGRKLYLANASFLGFITSIKERAIIRYYQVGS